MSYGTVIRPMTAEENRMMDPELKAKWVAALRSGEYEQGRGQLCLRTEGGALRYCCLGVLNEIAELGVPEACSFLSDDEDAMMSLVPGLPLEIQEELAGFNDDEGRNFAWIADWIEDNC